MYLILIIIINVIDERRLILNINMKSTVYSSVEYSKDKKHRYSLKKIWDSEKPIATIIMLNPREKTDALYQDKSIILFMNYCIDNNFGGMYVVNLFSIRCDSEIALKKISYNTRFDKSTDKYLREALEKSAKLYIGWGTNNNRLKRIKQVKKVIEKYKNIQIARLVNTGENAVHLSRASSVLIEEIIEVEQI